MAQAEIERMIHEAEAHAGEDKGRRELVEKRNALDSLIYQAEKTLSENEDKVSAEDLQGVRSALEEARGELESEDGARLDAAHQRVEKALHGVAEQLYKAQAGEQPPAAEPPGAEESAAPEDVVDAEYTEEKSDS